MSSSLIVHQRNSKLLDESTITNSNTSESININGYSLYAVQYIWTNSSGGAVVYLEASNDGTNFCAVDKFTLPATTDTRLINVEKAGYAHVRVRVADPGSSTGTITAILNGKVL